MRREWASWNWPRQAAAKKGEWQRTSSCAAKRRCSGPHTTVTMADVRLLRRRAPVRDSIGGHGRQSIPGERRAGGKVRRRLPVVGLGDMALVPERSLLALGRLARSMSPALGQGVSTAEHGDGQQRDDFSLDRRSPRGAGDESSTTDGVRGSSVKWRAPRRWPDRSLPQAPTSPFVAVLLPSRRLSLDGLASTYSVRMRALERLPTIIASVQQLWASGEGGLFQYYARKAGRRVEYH